MQGAEIRKNLPMIAAFVLPLLVVKLAAVVLGQSSPVGANAAPSAATTSSEALANAGTTKWTDQQLSAVRHIDLLRKQPFGPTPFIHEDGGAEGPAVVVHAPVVVVDGSDPSALTPIPAFKVGAVMASAGGRRALIDGRPYREGQKVRDNGWIVKTINCDDRSVTLQDPAAKRTVTVRVEMPN